MVEMQVRCHADSKLEGLFQNRWTFLVIERKEEITKIRQRIYNIISPFDDLRNWEYGLVNKRDKNLFYDFFSLSSDKANIDEPRKIYQVVCADEKLLEGSEERAVKYLESILKGRK